MATPRSGVLPNGVPEEDILTYVESIWTFSKSIPHKLYTWILIRLNGWMAHVGRSPYTKVEHLLEAKSVLSVVAFLIYVDIRTT